MQEVLKFLSDSSIFFLATVDGIKPRIRPFGFAMEFAGRLCFCTGNQKDVYRQMKENPNIEICAVSKDGRWLRISGEVLFVTSDESKEKAFETMPDLRTIYTDSSVFEIFTLNNASATFYSMDADSITIRF